MKTSTILILGLGAAALLYFTMRRPPPIRTAAPGTAAHAPDALTAGLELGSNVLSLFKSYTSTAPAESISLGTYNMPDDTSGWDEGYGS